ncbi:hypothetical protein EXIGLDRAFT_449705 [Exidia glandulosa HHB12029]|uniref:Uncharacterized protein n=1 Tax=Exidia glandulosa HHB12029 TaxID=1314781 RepID=A0A165K8N2_EXIGL|nr:hypothetical protein EXIGLDRAFT_449705 [Exidia glandulosa HHB12029]
MRSASSLVAYRRLRWRQLWQAFAIYLVSASSSLRPSSSPPDRKDNPLAVLLLLHEIQLEVFTSAQLPAYS